MPVLGLLFCLFFGAYGVVTGQLLLVAFGFAFLFAGLLGSPVREENG